MIHKMTSFSNLLHEKLDLESFKFCFTVAASLISELLEKYKLQKRSLRHFIGQLVSQLQNENIEECLTDLGLYEPSQAASRSRNPSSRQDRGQDMGDRPEDGTGGVKAAGRWPQPGDASEVGAFSPH